MKSKFKILVIMMIVLLAAVVCYKVFLKNTLIPSTNKLKIVATFYPLAHFASQVGGSLVDVQNITPAGAEPHDYEPTPQDIVKVYDSRIFILNGGGLDTWAEKIEPDIKSSGIEVINMHNVIDFIKLTDKNFAFDPHIWLDPVLVQQETRAIKDALARVDPGNAGVYGANAENYVSKLKDLDGQYQSGLANCRIHDIITSHSAFEYLAKRYNFNQISVTGLSPDAEPSSQKIAEISYLAKNKNIKYIFFETLVSPKISQTIANEIGAQAIAFNPLEGLTKEEINSGKTYLSEMQNNLVILRKALECE